MWHVTRGRQGMTSQLRERRLRLENLGLCAPGFPLYGRWVMGELFRAWGVERRCE
jgi:hypothetical protein